MDNEKTNDMGIQINLDAGNGKIKYYETDNSSCVFEIMEDSAAEEKTCRNGRIEAITILDYGQQDYIQGVKINLYKINGLTPILVSSQITNEEGKVCFEQVEFGNYRIIEIVDKKYFEKPKYIKWNEITIDSNNLESKIIILNRLKKRN